MDPKLEEIIKASSFEVVLGIFVYCQVRSFPKGEGHFMVTQDNDEITVVTTLSRVGELDLVERNKDDYSLIALNVSVPFYSVGFLATISGALAGEGMNVLIVSTYSKDYVMVTQDRLEDAKSALLAIGLKSSE